jgi:hypothetical protein
LSDWPLAFADDLKQNEKKRDPADTQAVPWASTMAFMFNTF